VANQRAATTAHGGCCISADRQTPAQRHRNSLTLATALACAALAIAPAASDAQSAKPVSVSAALTGLTTFDTNLDDDGGSFRWSGVNASASLTRDIDAQWSAGFNIGYQYERWSFSTPSAFGSEAPWGTINRPVVGVTVSYRLQPDVGIFLSPQFAWAYETHSSEQGENFGVVLGATKAFAPNRVIGIGVGVFHQIDETRVFPFPIVNWRIDERWKIASPLRAGPAGGAGLELAYALSENWELAGGGTYREYRFRLKRSGPNANGIGENEGIPLFARLTRKLGASARLDVWAGATVAGTLKLRDPDGNTLVSSDYNAAPFVAVTIAGDF
jgi:hypothetical protein